MTLVGVIATAWVVVEDTQWCVALSSIDRDEGRAWAGGVVALAGTTLRLRYEASYEMRDDDGVQRWALGGMRQTLLQTRALLRQRLATTRWPRWQAYTGKSGSTLLSHPLLLQLKDVDEVEHIGMSSSYLLADR